MSDSPYNYTFDPEGESTAAHVIRYVGQRKNVLELGCAYGVMTKVLLERAGCNIYAIDADERSAQYARPYCETLAIVDIDRADWDELFGDRRFDVIIAADVLEHLRDPQACMNALRKFLTPEGYFVLSVPNVCHNGVIAELLAQDFRYRETGLLDKTHIHFFGAQGISRLLTDAGLVVSNIVTTRIEPELSEFSESWAALPENFTKTLGLRSEGSVYQYVIKASPATAEDHAVSIDWPNTSPHSELIHEIPRAVAERDQAIAERDVAVAQRNDAVAERDHALQELQVAVGEREAAMAARADAVARSEEATAVREAAIAERDVAIAGYNALTQSSSWRLTKPLRFAARLLRYGFIGEDKRKAVEALKRAYHRLPLPDPLKKLVNSIYRKTVRRVVPVLRRTVTDHLPFSEPDIRPAHRLDDLPDYLSFGVIDWHFRHQRPQQLSLALATTGRRIFYISPELVNDERSGFSVEAIGPSGRVFQVRLFAKGAPPIYFSAPSLESVEQLRQSLGAVLNWADCRQTVALVQHPFWVDIAKAVPNTRLVYDCMDHHEGFGNFDESLLQLERLLMTEAELTITTSSWLDETVAKQASRTAIIRNACEYKHFAQTPENIYRDPKGRRIIGYYGAIAEWFDLDLVEAIARHFSEHLVLLIGSDTVHAQKKLGKVANISFTGEVSYTRLPYYLYGFDVCLLPFRVMPLTLATNPVKIYEYLSAGKPVVGVDLPEMRQFDGLVSTASGKDEFLAAVAHVLGQSEPQDLIERRKTFAAGQTWEHRGAMLIREAESDAHDPTVSVIVVTYNNIELTRACLDSLEAHSQYARLEIVVVDNASSDGSPELLREWAADRNERKLVLNEDNRGFAAANNQGLALATGEYLVLLNNDTYVTPGWIRSLLKHLHRDTTIGLIGPVTNNIGNEAKIDIHYDDMAEMLVKAAAYTRRHIGQLYPIRTAAFFCAMMPREIYECVGQLDEAYGRGFFEDDDYCRRIEQAGKRIVCAEDVFVHHNLSASFDKIKIADRLALFEHNKAVYEAKWGKWIPHSYRDAA